MLLDAAGLVLLTRLEAGSTYAGDILPSLILVGAGLGLVFPPATNTATARVDPAESGIASSLVSVGQQVGGSLGTALLNTVAVSATTDLPEHARTAARISSRPRRCMGTRSRSGGRPRSSSSARSSAGSC